MDISVQKTATQGTAPFQGSAPKIDGNGLNDAFFAMLNQVRSTGSASQNAEAVHSRISEKSNAREAFRETGKTSGDKPRDAKADASSKAVSKPKTAQKTTQAQSRPKSGQKIPASANNTSYEEAEETSQPRKTEATVLAAQETDFSEDAPAAAKNKDAETENKPETAKIEAGGIALAPALAEKLSAEIKTNAGDISLEETVSKATRPEALPDAEKTSPSDDAEAVFAPTEKAMPSDDGEDSPFKALTAKAAAPKDSARTAAPREAKPEEQQETDEKTPAPASFSAAARPAEKQEQAQLQKSAETETSRHQASEIAKTLPQEAKIAISVENDTAKAPVAQAAVVREKPAKAEKTEEEAVSFIDTGKTAKNTASENTAYTASAAPKAEAFGEKQDSDAGGQNAQERSFAGEQALAAQASGTPAPNQTGESFSSALKQDVSVGGVQAKAGASEPQAAFALHSDAGLKGKAVQETAAMPQKSLTPTNQLVDQIKINISKAMQEGVEKININLKPQELGSIRITLEVDGEGNLKASIIASRAETLDMLQKDASLLKQALNDAGLKTNDNAFSFSYRGEPQSGGEFAHREHRSSSHHQPSNAEAAEADDLTEAVIASNWSNSRHALNIRV